MKISINILKENPLNQKIYGDDDEAQFNELVEKIKDSGYIKAILINKDYMIISGHRRVKAAKAAKVLNIEAIDCEFVGTDPDKEVEIFLNENAYRLKTQFQLMKEAEIYFEIEKKKAYERQIETGKQNLDQFSVGVSRTSLEDKGRTTEKVAKKIGMSESSYKRGLTVLKRIEEEDDPLIEWLLGESFNENISDTEKLAKKPIGFLQEVIEKTGGDKEKIPSSIYEVEQEELKQKSHLPPGKYGIIYFDMTNRQTDYLLKTTISYICEDDCVLLFWVKNHQLESGMEICKHWGFRYCNYLVWNRDVMNEVSEYGELLLVFVKGSPKTIFKTHEGSTEKPPSVKEIIKIGYPGWSKVEIFVDQEIEGWEIW